MRITEENFISEIISGNEDGLEYLLEQYGWIIKSVVSKHLVLFPHHKDECINDILLAVWQNVNRFDASKNSFKNWLAGVSKYTALNYVRKYKRDLENITLDDTQISDNKNLYDEMTKNELSSDFEELLKCLGETDKEIFIQLYIKEQSVVAVSSQMDMKPEAIYNRISRAKKKIKNIFVNFRGD